MLQFVFMIDDWETETVTHHLADWATSYSHFLKYFNLCFQPASVFWLVTKLCNKADPTRPIRRFVISTFLSVPGKPLCWECWEFSANIHSLPVSSGRLKNYGIFISGGHVKTGLKGFFWRYNFLLIITFVLETVIWKWGWGEGEVASMIFVVKYEDTKVLQWKIVSPVLSPVFSASFIFSSCWVQLSWVNIGATSKI